MRHQTIKLPKAEETRAAAFSKFSLEVFDNGRFCLWFQRHNGGASVIATGGLIVDGISVVIVPDTEHDEEDRLRELDERVYAVLAEFAEALQIQWNEEVLELSEALDCIQDEPKSFP